MEHRNESVIWKLLYLFETFESLCGTFILLSETFMWSLYVGPACGTFIWNLPEPAARSQAGPNHPKPLLAKTTSFSNFCGKKNLENAYSKPSKGCWFSPFFPNLCILDPPQKAALARSLSSEIAGLPGTDVGSAPLALDSAFRILVSLPPGNDHGSSTAVPQPNQTDLQLTHSIPLETTTSVERPKELLTSR